MNKTQLVDHISRQTKFTKTSVEETINCAIDAIKKCVERGDSVTLLGFGTFYQSTRKARSGRNPHTGEKMEIPEMNLPRFKPSKDFKNRTDRHLTH